MLVVLGAFTGFYLFGSAGQNTDPNAGFMTPPRVKKNNRPSDHDLNQKHIANINKILSELSPSFDILLLTHADIATINSLSDKNLEQLKKQLEFIKNTPGRTKENIAESLARTYKNFITDAAIDEVDANNKLQSHAKLGSHVKKLINEHLSLIDSPMRADLSAVHMNHVMDARIQYDVNGDIVKISGGHAQTSYLDSNTGSFLGDSKGFLSPDGKTMGISFSDKIGKTIEAGLSPQQILSDLKNGRVIAVAPDKMQVRQISPGRFVGAYVEAQDPLMLKTQFPILVISQANKNAQGQLYVGDLVELNKKDGSIRDDIASVDLFLTQNQFDAIMADSSLKSFAPEKPGVIVKNITPALQKVFAKELTDFGMTQFPTPIYGAIGVAI